MLHQFETKYANFVYAILTNKELTDDERSTLIADMMEEFRGSYPNLQDAVTSRELSETELRLQKEIAEIKLELTKHIDDTKLELSKEIKELDVKISDTKLELTKEIKELDVKLSKEIKETKSELLKWTFGFWVSQITVIAGVGFFVYKAISM
jgi:phenylalanyl-tRNA synthetase alpha subunit